MSTRMAQVARRVEACGGRVTEERLDEILREFGITRQKQDYKTKMVEYGYLQYDSVERRYRLTCESGKTATIEITVKPSLYVEEVRRHLVETLAAYGGIIEVGEVEI
jgi:hypothetical protein